MAVRDVERLDDAISWLAARASRLGGAPMRPAVRCACRAASPRRDIFGVSSTVAGRICSQLMMIRNRPSLGAVRALRAFTVGRPRRARGHWEVFRPPAGVEEGCGYASSRVGHRGDGPAARAHRGQGVIHRGGRRVGGFARTERRCASGRRVSGRRVGRRGAHGGDTRAHTRGASVLRGRRRPRALIVRRFRVVLVAVHLWSRRGAAVEPTRSTRRLRPGRVRRVLLPQAAQGDVPVPRGGDAAIGRGREGVRQARHDRGARGEDAKALHRARTRVCQARAGALHASRPAPGVVLRAAGSAAGQPTPGEQGTRARAAETRARRAPRGVLRAHPRDARRGGFVGAGVQGPHRGRGSGRGREASAPGPRRVRRAGRDDLEADREDRPAVRAFTERRRGHRRRAHRANLRRDGLPKRGGFHTQVSRRLPRRRRRGFRSGGLGAGAGGARRAEHARRARDGVDRRR